MERIIDEEKIISTIKCLGIDMIKNAGSGHSGVVLSAAPIIYALYAHHLRIDPKNPTFYNRDRFVLSAGHASALLYATLFMAGYDISIDDLKKFRKINSITPGHPEYSITPGVDASTGPLGQGIATAVGMAMAEAKTNMMYPNLIDYYTYVLCGDGCLEEGISYEAMSLAGNLGLKKLIVLYDSNDVSLDGRCDKTFSDNIEARVKSQNWNYILVSDGTRSIDIKEAIDLAKTYNQPTLIEVKTVLGKGSFLEGSNKVHGSVLTDDDILNIKNNLDMRNIPFVVSQNTLDDFRYLINNRCSNIVSDFNEMLDNIEDKDSIEYLMSMGKSIDTKLIHYDIGNEESEELRITSKKILSSIVNKTNYFFGGSADLASSCKSYVDGAGDFSKYDYLGKNIFYGVREMAMASIMNGISLSGYRTYGSTFLSFSNYMLPAIRLAAMMKLVNLYIFTHDSISIGSDGPTHQPIEQLSQLRSIPDLDVFRPADVNEVIGSYQTILEKNSKPSALILSKNKLDILELTKASEVKKGGYVIFDSLKRLDGILISSGEEVHLALEVAKKLRFKGINVRVVSMPNVERFLSQSDEYIDQVLPVEVRKIVIEASSSFGWDRIIFNRKYLITIDSFGLSGTKDELYKHFGFDLDSLEKRIEELLK